MNNNPVTPEQADAALDSLDDFSRMAGVDAAGPRETLERFIEQAREGQGAYIADDLAKALDNLLTVHRGSSGPRVEPNAEEIAEVALSRYFSRPQQAQGEQEAAYLIHFEDVDMGPEIVVGEKAAWARYERVSTSWTAHLFVKLDSNTRDCTLADANYRPPAPAAVPEEWRQAMQRVLDWFDLCNEEGDIICPGEEYARIKKLLTAAPTPTEPKK